MVERPRTEAIELEVEQLSYAPGAGVHRLARAGRWWDAPVLGTRADAPRSWAASTPGTTATTVLTGSTSFWRIVDVPGDQLGRVLGAWWLRSDHNDGHLRLSEPRLVKGTWQVGGSFRMTPLSRGFAVELRFSAHARFWTLLELTPRRVIKPSRRYFRVGHDALDVLAGTLRDLV